jgi:hypothetical protein
MSDTIEQRTALAIIPTSAVSVILGQSDEATNILKSIADKVAGYKPDISTPKGRKECASMAAQIATAKMDMVRLANGMMEADKARIASVLGERKVIEERMDELKVQVRQPLTDFENAEKARVSAHEAALSEIAGLVNGVHGMSSDDINVLLDRLTEIAQGDVEWQEFTVRAQDLIRQVDGELHAALNVAYGRERDAAELARLQAIEAERAAQEAAQRQAEREAQIAKEAAEVERTRALIREKQAQELAERAAQEAACAAALKIEAAERAAAKAERDAAEAAENVGRVRQAAIEVERARAAQVAADAQAEADRRAADLSHRKRINNELLADLRKCELEEATAKALIKSIAKGEIRHLTIGY